MAEGNFGLTDEKLQQFEGQGYGVLPEVVGGEELAMLRAERDRSGRHGGPIWGSIRNARSWLPTAGGRDALPIRSLTKVPWWRGRVSQN